MTFQSDPLEKIKLELDKISASFCSAKWLQVTLHLQNGHTHSCHHPATHQVPLVELKENPSALHNTKLKKELRREMLQGKRPSECNYCWKIEDLPDSHYSDRHIKSDSDWARPHLDSLTKTSWTDNINPTYLEVSFSNTCNFRCAYCSPDSSSKWMSEIKEHGPYPTSTLFGNLAYLKDRNLLPIPEEENPYVEAFWKWWPDLYKELKVFRITGGEPLLSPNTFKVLDHIKDNPNPSLELAINSNLGVPTELVRKLADKLFIIEQGNSAKSISVYTSVDTWGIQAEYIRTGLKLSLFQQNIDILFEKNPEMKMVIMCTFNALSIFQFTDLIDFLIDQKMKGRQLTIDISYLRSPEFLDVRILPDEWKEKFANLLRYMHARAQTNERVGLKDYEIMKMERVASYAQSECSADWLEKQRSDFVAYFEEYDKRRNCSFERTFPEFRGTFLSWKKKRKNLGIRDTLYLWYIKLASR